MSREELLTLLAVLIRVHGIDNKLLCSKEVYETLPDGLAIENRLLGNGDIELHLIEG